MFKIDFMLLPNNNKKGKQHVNNLCRDCNSYWTNQKCVLQTRPASSN